MTMRMTMTDKRAGAFARGREDWLRLRGQRDRPGPDWMLAALHLKEV